MLTESCEKDANLFKCKICEYNTSRKSSYDKHLLTSKHIKLTIVNDLLTKSCTKVANNTAFLCQNCNKEYKSRVGLWKHKKNCIIENKILNNNEFDKTEDLIKYLMKENAEFKQMLIDQNKQMIEMAKDAGNNNTTNNNTNSHNKAFNLNFFLNETCKDAMNIMDFVDSIQLQLSDLENVGKLGYVEGISNIIIKNLKELDMEKRPVHCTDKKRETMYVKDENKWEKDDGNKKISKAIKRVVSKNQRLIPKFKEAHPDCNTYHSKFSDQYNKLIVESCGGSGDNDLEKEEKIIKNISKNVLVDK